MKKNLFVLLVIVMLSAFTAVMGGTPRNWNDFFMGFGLCFVFWFCMLAPAFSFKDCDNSYMTDEAIREKYAK